ncbi:MAG: RNA polymerase sigma factor [Flavobacteriales bacterium]|nr:RNA polymerase sigma factor [Flavobacteriales bacterium]
MLSHVLFKKKVKPDAELSDEDLVAELQRAMDADRFGVLYDRYTTKVYQKCVGMTRDKELANDLTHDIFLKAFMNLSKFDHRSKFGTWLYSITYNYCMDHLRKGQRRRTTELDEERYEEADVQEDRYEQELLSLRADRLTSVLEALEPGDRATLLMKYQDELSVKEMMEVLGVSESAVKMRAMRARERALAMYHELYREEP